MITNPGEALRLFHGITCWHRSRGAGLPPTVHPEPMIGVFSAIALYLRGEGCGERNDVLLFAVARRRRRNFIKYHSKFIMFPDDMPDKQRTARAQSEHRRTFRRGCRPAEKINEGAVLVRVLIGNDGHKLIVPERFDDAAHRQPDPGGAR